MKKVTNRNISWTRRYISICKGTRRKYIIKNYTIIVLYCSFSGAAGFD